MPRSPSRITLAYVFSVAGLWGFGLLGAAMDSDAFVLLAAASFVAMLLLGVIWLGQAFDDLSPEDRRTSGGDPVSPGRAVGLLFIPIFNFYWIYAANVGVARSYNAVLARRGSPVRANETLASGASILQCIPNLNVLFGPFVWMAHMVSVDAARKAAMGTIESAEFVDTFR